MKALRIIIAGGGTGGHIFPAVAIGHALKAMSAENELLFVGAKGKMEMTKVPLEGFEIVGLDIEVTCNRAHAYAAYANEVNVLYVIKVRHLVCFRYLY